MTSKRDWPSVWSSSAFSSQRRRSLRACDGMTTLISAPGTAATLPMTLQGCSVCKAGAMQADPPAGGVAALLPAPAGGACHRLQREQTDELADDLHRGDREPPRRAHPGQDP